MASTSTEEFELIDLASSSDEEEDVADKQIEVINLSSDDENEEDFHDRAIKQYCNVKEISPLDVAKYLQAKAQRKAKVARVPKRKKKKTKAEVGIVVPKRKYVKRNGAKVEQPLAKVPKKKEKTNTKLDDYFDSDYEWHRQLQALEASQMKLTRSGRQVKPKNRD